MGLPPKNVFFKHKFRNKLEIMFKKIFAIYENEYDLQLHYF